MIKYLIIKDFIERITLKQYRAGEKYTCPDRKRAEFLISTGYLAEAEEPEVKSENPKTETKTAKDSKKRSVKSKKA